MALHGGLQLANNLPDEIVESKQEVLARVKDEVEKPRR